MCFFFNCIRKLLYFQHKHFVALGTLRKKKIRLNRIRESHLKCVLCALAQIYHCQCCHCERMRVDWMHFNAIKSNIFVFIFGYFEIFCGLPLDTTQRYSEAMLARALTKQSMESVIKRERMRACVFVNSNMDLLASIKFCLFLFRGGKDCVESVLLVRSFSQRR